MAELIPSICGEPYEFVGVVIGRRHIGKRCAFIDLVKIDESTFLQNVEEKAAQRELVVHLVGDHVARAEPLSCSNVLETFASSDAEYHSIYAARGEDALTDERFAEFTASLRTPGEISKLRVGDILRVVACELQSQAPKRVRDIVMRRGNARRMVLLREGEIARPGDFGLKWNLPTKEKRIIKQGLPRHHRHRFRVFAEWCFATFSLRTTASGSSPSVLDIAGGSGELAEAFRTLGCTSTVVDPRPSFLARRGKNLNSVVSDDSSDLHPCVRDFFDFDRHGPFVATADLLVGLHCDGAVNEIVRAAAKAQKNFAICACCVFPKQYPRQLASGQPVILRDQLNAWIAEEVLRQGFVGHVGTTKLGFDGANEVVYGLACEVTTAARDSISEC
jgi:hypothetical protein